MNIASPSTPTAALLVIGNEILSGRTQDKNINFIACGLAELAIKFAEVRVIPDIEAEIISAVNHLRKKYDYLFTTGGIGPTHDDITAESIAKAFGVDFILHKQAEAILRDYYKDSITEARLRMARTPKGASLIANDISAAPGFVIENVFVMAGVPSIMQSMFNSLKPSLKKGSTVYSKEVSAEVAESKIALELEMIQKKYPETEIGSYPFMNEAKYGVSIVVKSLDKELTDKVVAEVLDMFAGKKN